MFPMGSQNQQFVDRLSNFCMGSHFNDHRFDVKVGNPTKSIVADNKEIFCVFCPHKLIVKIFKYAFAYTELNFLSRLLSFDSWWMKSWNPQAKHMWIIYDSRHQQSVHNTHNHESKIYPEIPNPWSTWLKRNSQLIIRSNDTHEWSFSLKEVITSKAKRGRIQNNGFVMRNQPIGLSHTFIKV